MAEDDKYTDYNDKAISEDEDEDFSSEEEDEDEENERPKKRRKKSKLLSAQDFVEEEAVETEDEEEEVGGEGQNLSNSFLFVQCSIFNSFGLLFHLSINYFIRPIIDFFQ
jgi:hypothetical protein